MYFRQNMKDSSVRGTRTYAVMKELQSEGALPCQPEQCLSFRETVYAKLSWLWSIHVRAA